MKHLLVITSIALLLSCSKKKEDPAPIEPTPTVQPTTLTMKILDQLGNKVPNANVKLFADSTAYKSNIGTNYTADANGVFSKALSPSKWYWKVTTLCDMSTTNTTTQPLKANVDNQVTVVLQGYGTITMNNSTTNPYYVYNDGNLLFTLEGNTSKEFTTTLGNHTVRVLQKSGYVLYPTDKSYSSTLSCSGIVKIDDSITFP